MKQVKYGETITIEFSPCDEEIDTINEMLKRENIEVKVLLLEMIYDGIN